MDPELDNNLAAHVLRSHVFRRGGEEAGEALRMDTGADVVIADAPEEEAVRAARHGCRLLPCADGAGRSHPRGGAYFRQVDETPVFMNLPGSSRRSEKVLTTDFVKKFILFAKARW
jgi:hypothetical protein